MSAKEGDSVEILGPLGRFVVEKQSPREKVFVATGTGIAPFRSMIKDVLESGWPGKIRLYWGLRYEEDVFWDEEFKSLQQAYPTFGYTLTLSRATDTWEESASRRRGRVTDHIIKEDNTSEKEYYLCGNRPMIDEIKSMLLAKGVPEVQMKTELFY
jgi:ferredoxin-NADP reductase